MPFIFFIKKPFDQNTLYPSEKFYSKYCSDSNQIRLNQDSAAKKLKFSEKAYETLKEYSAKKNAREHH